MTGADRDVSIQRDRVAACIYIQSNIQVHRESLRKRVKRAMACYSRIVTAGIQSGSPLSPSTVTMTKHSLDKTILP